MYSQITKVYVDGSCRNNHNASLPRKAGYGVWFGENDPRNAWGPVKGVPPTNQNAEIEAAIQAMKILRHGDYEDVHIISDSDFLKESMTKYLPKWKKNGWLTSDGEPVKNKVKFMELDKLVTSSGLNIEWKHVPAHKGVRGNEEADRLAKKGAGEY